MQNVNAKELQIQQRHALDAIKNGTSYLAASKQEDVLSENKENLLVQLIVNIGRMDDDDDNG